MDICLSGGKGISVMSVLFARCRMSYTLRQSSQDVASDDVKYDVSNYTRVPATFWASSSRPPCHHWPPCLTTATTPNTVLSTSKHHRSDPNILLSPVAGTESGRLWDAVVPQDGRRCESVDALSSSSPHRSRCLLHSSPTEITSVALPSADP